MIFFQKYFFIFPELVILQFPMAPFGITNFKSIFPLQTHTVAASVYIDLNIF